MAILQTLFWLSLALLFYSYIGYGVLIFMINKMRKLVFSRAPGHKNELVPLTLVVAAYNEERILPQKIRNCLEIDYPRELLNIIFITDGSTDNSAELIAKHDFITLLHQSKREGKLNALKRAMRFVKTPIVVFSDANSMVNAGCLKAIVPHYACAKVGGVAGEKRIREKGGYSAVGQAEGLYWKYESFLKKQDADFNTVVGAAGELFSLRTELFQALDENLILDDFLLSMLVCLQGYKIAYEPGAFAIETPSASLADEEKRKIRIAAGAYQSMAYLKQCLNIFKFPRLSLQYFSRRLVRCLGGPVFILLVLFTNIEIVLSGGDHIFIYLLAAQGIFYIVALAGGLFIGRGRRMGIAALPFYFVFAHLCLVRGFFRYAQGRQTVLWEKSIREAIE